MTRNRSDRAARMARHRQAQVIVWCLLGMAAFAVGGISAHRELTGADFGGFRDVSPKPVRIDAQLPLPTPEPERAGLLT